MSNLKAQNAKKKDNLENNQQIPVNAGLQADPMADIDLKELAEHVIDA